MWLVSVSSGRHQKSQFAGLFAAPLALAVEHGFRSVAFPLIGAGTGGGRADRVQAIMEEEIRQFDFFGEVFLVRYKRNSEPSAATNGGPAASVENSSAPGGPPSAS